jgi:uncharacterized membrane protein YdjX (TVP38/TMEM64 family)
MASVNAAGWCAGMAAANVTATAASKNPVMGNIVSATDSDVHTSWIHSNAARYAVFAMWAALVAGALYLYLFQRDFVQSELQGALSTSTVIASILYVVLGALRGFTFVPATFLLFIAMPFFPPTLLLLLTLPGIVISSSLCYFFADALQISEPFERRYPKHIATLQRLLRRHTLAISIGWSFMLFLPTDLLCYVAGTLRASYARFITGVLIGEGTVYAIYIYLGAWLLQP